MEYISAELVPLAVRNKNKEVRKGIRGQSALAVGGLQVKLCHLCYKPKVIRHEAVRMHPSAGAYLERKRA